jgi:hypothetical protein
MGARTQILALFVAPNFNWRAADIRRALPDQIPGTTARICEELEREGVLTRIQNRPRRYALSVNHQPKGTEK